MAQRSLFRCVYMNPGNPKVAASPAADRDGTAWAEFREPAAEAGLKFNMTLNFYPDTNLPADSFLGQPPPKGLRWPEGLVRLLPEHVLAMTIRLPKSDSYPPPDWTPEQIKAAVAAGRRFHRRFIRRAGGDLEGSIFEATNHCLPYVSRELLEFAPELVPLLPDPLLARLVFNTNGMGKIKGYMAKFTDGTSREWPLPPQWNDFDAIGIYIHVPRIPKFGCAFLGSFSMGGYETLVFNSIMRHRYAAWISRPMFAIVAMKIGPEPHQPVSVCVDRIPSWPLLTVDLDMDGRPLLHTAVSGSLKNSHVKIKSAA